MPYVIAEPCIDEKNGSCVDVCPVACIHTTPEEPQYYIDPEVCIDCEQCALVCPVDAIFSDDDLPAAWRSYIVTNAAFFRRAKEIPMQVPASTAMRMVEAAQAKAAELGVSITPAVTDDSGRLVALGRMDDARPISVDVATHKAYTASTFQRPSKEMAELAEQPWMQALIVSSGGKIMPVGGGLPIIANAHFIGAIGVSGASEDQDIMCAQAGLASAV